MSTYNLLSGSLDSADLNELMKLGVLYGLASNNVNLNEFTYIDPITFTGWEDDGSKLNIETVAKNIGRTIGSKVNNKITITNQSEIVRESLISLTSNITRGFVRRTGKIFIDMTRSSLMRSDGVFVDDLFAIDYSNNTFEELYNKAAVSLYILSKSIKVKDKTLYSEIVVNFPVIKTISENSLKIGINNYYARKYEILEFKYIKFEGDEIERALVFGETMWTLFKDRNLFNYKGVSIDLSETIRAYTNKGYYGRTEIINCAMYK